MPSSSKSPSGPLASAAAALEGELQRYASVVAELEKTPVTSDKTLQRARKLLEECAAREQRLAELLPAFATAMREVQTAQQACMEATARSTERIRSRFADRMALLERIAALGERAQSIHAPVAAILEGDSETRSPAELLKSLDEVNSRTSEVIADAETLRAAAKEGDWLDIERDADALKQQLQSARNKVLAAQRNVALRSPS